MKKSTQNTVVKVVDNLLQQYLLQLKDYREWADVTFTTTETRDDNVVKCDKGIKYAELLRENLTDILFRDSVWSKKELIYKFHRGASEEDVPLKTTHTKDCKVVARNVEVILESMGMRTWELLPSVLGYVIDRSYNEVCEEGNCPEHDGGVFGRLTVNYGKTKDFDVFSSKADANLSFDLRPIYNIIRKDVLRKVNVLTNNFVDKKIVLESSLKDIIDCCYFGPGDYCCSHSDFYAQQQHFTSFRHHMKDTKKAESEFYMAI